MSRKNPVTTNSLIIYTDGNGRWYLKYPEDGKERIDCDDFHFISFMTALTLNKGNIDEVHEKVWGDS